jgi:hypothetical protein
MRTLNIILKIARRGLLALICLAGFSALADTQGDQDSLTAANTGFAFDLLKQIADKQPGGNVFISPSPDFFRMATGRQDFRRFEFYGVFTPLFVASKRGSFYAGSM